ncbi:LysR substrate-binding domain-containing protein [Amycolatopsis sp.]|uniref:LysR substrate-binding domain-containing protein n=1 Tax=Amycolatopsis sp. TaxID=37632 RepID=UPI002D7F8274|nr:LysR substrate-binding domain-containing protein [Amycolatopsis sp.]HET6706663.1 LysR substrate-binding domain-containing protein [Amycolatopsis sp.]
MHTERPSPGCRSRPGSRGRSSPPKDRWVALPSGHRLAARETVPLSELAGEPFIALPRSAGPLREFWPGNDRRAEPARVVAEAGTVAVSRACRPESAVQVFVDACERCLCAG